jgi:molybdate transport system substrate-binding protein
VRLDRSVPLLLFALLAAACTTGSAAPAAGGSIELQVYGAASLKPALDRIVDAYGSSRPGVTLTVSTDSSTALATKIEQGAPADVFLSADTANPQRLVGDGLAAGPMVVFAGNELTIIVPKANPAGIASPVDIARPGVKVVAAARGVPIQTYTARWVAEVAALPAYRPDFAAGYAANVVSREDNVGAVVAKIALDEGDAAVVYVTDARASGGVATIEIPADQNVSASYGGVVVKASPHVDAATAFLDWLKGPDGQAILATFGFLPPAE